MLFFCRQGEYRSACVATVCVCALGLMEVAEALRLVRASRRQALPNNSRANDDIARLQRNYS